MNTISPFSYSEQGKSFLSLSAFTSEQSLGFMFCPSNWTRDNSSFRWSTPSLEDFEIHSVFSGNWNPAGLATVEVSKDLSIRNETYTRRTSQSRCIYSFLSSPLHFSTDLSYRYSLAVGVSPWRSDGSLQQPYPKGNTWKSLQCCAGLCHHPHNRLSHPSHWVPGLKLQHNPACQLRHTQWLTSPHITRHFPNLPHPAPRFL